MATNISSRIFENMEMNCFNVLSNIINTKPNLLMTLSFLRLLVAHRCHLGVESGTTALLRVGRVFEG